MGRTGHTAPMCRNITELRGLEPPATREEIEELLLFMCVYAGFNKAAAGIGVLNELLGPAGAGKK